MKKLLVIVLSASIAGCATTSPVLQPQLAAPAAWNEAPARGAAALSADWWTAFGSAELHALVEQALAGSPDLAIAAERVRQAESQVRAAGASLFPSVDLGASSSARRTRHEDTGRFDSESSGTTLSASYELDLWGANRAGVRGAEASLQATTFDRDAVQLTLVAAVASAYFEVLSLRGRIAVARENLGLAERVLSLVQVRAREGAVSPLDLARQEAAVLSQRAAVVSLEQQERQVLTALAVLTGRLPEGFQVEAQGLSDLAVPAIAPGLPADLLVRRPDLASAEAQLVAANADLAAARAALLPSIQLTGSAGVASGALLNFLGGPTTTVALAASVLQPIFDGGRRRAGVAIAESRERELVERYRAAILAAFGDVETALAAASRLREREALQVQVEARAREALRLAEVRYREGADDLLSVLDAQRTLFDAQQQLALVRLDRLDAAVSLFKALGGGWQARTDLAARSTAE
ncbi:MAG TPA: efflux transporter outer membrane subunit [Burkholderiales bacterium]|nr:efflux transporter outer membrane subunit [Burkholderiales bacterium]